MNIQIRVEHLCKTFVLHQQHGTQLPVLQDANMTVSSGECVVLHGHSGSGKSTLLRSLYAQLPARQRPYLGQSSGRMAGHGAGRSTPDAGSTPAHPGLGQPVSAGDPAHSRTGRGHATAVGTGR